MAKCNQLTSVPIKGLSWNISAHYIGMNNVRIVLFLNGDYLSLNKITFKRTLSLSNAVCIKHDNNVCACAVSVLILLPVVNLSPEMNSATSISYMT